MSFKCLFKKLFLTWKEEREEGRRRIYHEKMGERGMGKKAGRERERRGNIVYTHTSSCSAAVSFELSYYRPLLYRYNCKEKGGLQSSDRDTLTGIEEQDSLNRVRKQNQFALSRGRFFAFKRERAKEEQEQGGGDVAQVERSTTSTSSGALSAIYLAWCCLVSPVRK